MRSLTKFLLALLLVSGTAYAFAKPVTAINHSIQTTEDRHITGFNGVDVAGPFDVMITQGSAESVKVEAPSDVIGRIITEVNNGVLKIYSKNDGFHWNDWFGHHKKIMVYVTAKDLNKIALTGSGDVKLTNTLNTNSLKLSLSGSGDMMGSVSVKELSMSLSGSGDLKVSGKAENSQISMSGSGDLSAGNLVTSNTSVHISGSGDARVNVNTSLDASVSGSGDIRYSGAVKQVLSSKSGSGDISRN